MKDNNSKKKNRWICIIVFIILLFICFSVAIMDNDNEKNIKYEELNIQQLHNDYENNEINAKDKYVGKHYTFTANIPRINQYLNDNYLTFTFKSNEDKNKSTEIDSYFNNAEDLMKLNKIDNVTLYCKFKQRSINNYMSRTTSYSFKNCKLQ